MIERDDESAIVATFLQQYAADRVSGSVRDLAAYQQRYPGYEAVIAVEYDALQSGNLRHEPGSGVRHANGVDGVLSPDAASRYSSPEEIARGGMSVVFRVWDRDLQRSVAMKVLPGPGAANGRRDPRATERFLREARITGQLGHPGIVPVHALGKDADGRFFFTMAMVDGQDFGAIIRSARGGVDPHWTLPRAVDVILRVCDAMAFAHGKGVLHRDLKPGNVMVGRFGETYVMDWGLAHEAAAAEGGHGGDLLDAMLDARHTLAGDVFGTPAYMPPEQARGDVAAIDCRSDVYAIGAMLFELLAGTPPYTEPDGDNSSLAVLARVVAGPAPTLDNVANVASELDAICTKAMARERADRYQTMSDLAADLRAFLEQRVVRAYEVGAFAELRKWVRRNRALAFAGLLLVAGPAFFAVREHQVRTEITAARDSAEGQLATRQEILRFLDEDLLAAVAPEEQGRDVSMRKVLDVAAKRIEGRFQSRPEIEAELRMTIGSTYRKLSILDAAEHHLQRSVDLWLQVAGQDDRRTLAAQRQLAMTFRMQDRLPEAEQLNRMMLAVSERVLGPADEDTLSVTNNLGYVLLRMGRYADAEPLLRHAHELRLRKLGGEHEQTRVSIGNLGQLYRLWGRLEQAGPLLERSLQLARANLPADHPQQLLALQEWNNFLVDTGRRAEALAHTAGLCELSDRIRGPRHVETIRCWMNLTISHRNSGQHQQALAAVDQAIERSADLPEHHHLRYEQQASRADALSGLGRTAEALQQLDDAQARLLSQPKPLASLRYDLTLARATVLRRTDDWAAALVQFEALVALCDENELGRHRRGVARMYHGRALTRLGRLAEAEAALQGAEADVAGTASMKVLCGDFIELYRASGRPEDVARWQRKREELIAR